MSSVWDAIKDIRARLPKMPMAMYTTEHLCAGAGTDLMAMRILQLPHRCLGVAERKRCAQVWLKQQFGQDLGRLYTDNKAFLTGAGTDLLGVKNRCRKSPCVKVSSARPRCATAGLPCQPWSRARAKGGSTARSGCPGSHPDWQTTMVDFPKYLAVRKPEQFFIEEVPDIARRRQLPDDGDESIDEGEEASDLWEFMRRCVAAGFAVRSFKADHKMFVNVPRPRTGQATEHL